MKTVDFLLNFKAKTDAVTRATAQMEQNIDKVEKKASGFASTFKGMLGANLATTAITTALSAVTEFVKGSTEAWNVQALAEKKLETVMRQRMGATDAAIDSVKTLASAQQQLGIIGDEVQLSGAQQMATFLNEKKSLDVLMPAMNNLLAQQKGFNATQEDAVGIGNLIGKVMQGQTAALTRVGVTFTAAQEQVLKYGNEQQRAAMLAQVITDNVGNMNEALAATPEGKLKQLQNDYGDLQEQAGKLMTGIKSAFAPLGALLVGAFSKLMPYVEKIVKPLTVGILRVVEYLRQSKDMLVSLFAPVTQFIATLKADTEQWQSYILTVRDVVAGFVPVFKSILSTVMSIAGGIIEFVRSSEILKDVFSVIGGFALTLFDTVKEIVNLFSWLWNKVVMPILNGIDRMYKYVKELMGYKLKTGTKAATVQTPQKGISAPSLAGSPAASLATTPNTLGQSDKGKQTAESVATGGTRSTSVYVNIAKLIETMNTYKTESESNEDFYDRVVEAVVRAVNIGTAAAR